MLIGLNSDPEYKKNMLILQKKHEGRNVEIS